MRGLVPAIGCALALAPASPAVAGGWTPPVEVAGPADEAGPPPTVAVNPRGDAVIAWPGQASMHAASRRGRGAFARSSLPVADRVPLFPAVGLDGAGDMTLLWPFFRRRGDPAGFGCCEGLAAANGHAGRSRFAGPRRLPGSASAYVPSYDVAANGARTVAAWTQGGYIYVAEAERGRLLPARRLPRPTGAIALALAVGPRGDGVLAWIERDETTQRVMAARWPAGKRPAGARELARAPAFSASLSAVEAAVDVFGRALVTFARDVPRGEHSIHWAAAAPGHAFRPARPIPGAEGPVVGRLALAVGERGAAALAWSGGSSGRQAQVSMAPPRGRFATPVAVSRAPAGTVVLDADVAVSGFGRVVAVWSWTDPPLGAGRSAVEAGFGRAGKGFGPPMSVAGAPDAGAANGGSRVAVDGRGNVLVTWVASGSSGERLLRVAEYRR